MKIKIQCPDDNIKERSYAIDILFKEILGLDYEIQFSKKTNYIIKFENKTLIIKDHFFGYFPNILSYLDVKNIPININTATKEELVTLKHIGDKIADRIMAYREAHPFQKSEDIMKVKGIGQKVYDVNKDLIVVKDE